MGTIVFLWLLVVVLLVVVARAVRRRLRRRAGAAASQGLRNQALQYSAADIGLTPKPGEAWGILMDLGYENGAASLVSFADGSASIYFSSGGGVIGGQAHESVANAARAFVQAATAHLPQMAAPSDLALPRPGLTRFFVFTPEGRRFAEAPEQELGEGKHPLSPLFYAGQNVITELRLLSTV